MRLLPRYCHPKLVCVEGQRQYQTTQLALKDSSRDRMPPKETILSIEIKIISHKITRSSVEAEQINLVDIPAVQTIVQT